MYAFQTKVPLELKLEAGLIDKKTQLNSPMGHLKTEGRDCEWKSGIQFRTNFINPLLAIQQLYFS